MKKKYIWLLIVISFLCHFFIISVTANNLFFNFSNDNEMILQNPSGSVPALCSESLISTQLESSCSNVDLLTSIDTIHNFTDYSNILYDWDDNKIYRIGFYLGANSASDFATTLSGYKRSKNENGSLDDSAGTICNNEFSKVTINSGLFNGYDSIATGRPGGTTQKSFFDIELTETYRFFNSSKIILSTEISCSDIFVDFLLNDDKIANGSFDGIGYAQTETMHNLSPNQNFYFNRLRIWKPETGTNPQLAGDYVINGMYFYNVSLTNNTLPSGNFTITNENICINENSYIDINVTGNFTDIESDTILYSSGLFNYYRIDLFFMENFRTNTNDCEIDYNFFSSDNYYSNYSTINNYADYLLWNFYPFSHNTHVIKKEIDDLDNCLTYLYTSENIDKFLIKPDDVYNYDIGIFELIEIPDNNTKFDIVYVDSDRNIILNISYFQNETGFLKVDFDGSEIHNSIHDNTELLYSYVLINKSNSNVSFQLLYDNIISTPVEYSKNYNVKDWYGNFYYTYVTTGSSINPSYWKLHRISTEGSNYKYDLSFDENNNFTIRINNTGTYYLDLFVSDNIHEPNIYDIYTNTINIKNCENNPILNRNEHKESLIDEYTNERNLTGIALIFDEFLYLKLLPYRFLVYYGLLLQANAGIVISFLIYSIHYMTSNKEGFEPSLKGLFTQLFFISCALSIMRIMYFPFFIFVSAIFAFYIKQEYNN